VVPNFAFKSKELILDYENLGLGHYPKHNWHNITKVCKKAKKLDGLLKRDFSWKIIVKMHHGHN